MNQKNNIVFFDLETNGKENRSVLSIAAIKCQFRDNNILKIDEPYIRYYFRKPGELLDIEALKIHGLSDEIIFEKRNNSKYELFFYKDMMSFKKYCEDTIHYVGHNINYDRKFINFELKYTFCTMIENVNIVKIKNEKGQNKWPKLEETANFYGIQLEKTMLHDSFYDISLTYEIFIKMLSGKNTKNRVLSFLKKQ